MIDSMIGNDGLFSYRLTGSKQGVFPHGLFNLISIIYMYDDYYI